MEPHPDDLSLRPNIETSHGLAPGVRLAQTLGWLSLGVGLTQVLAPRALARLIGVRTGGEGAMRVLGVRELLSGLALLTDRGAGWWTTARLAGDLVDGALLGLALARGGNQRGRLLAAAGVVVGAALADTVATVKLAGDPGRPEQVAGVTHVGKAITIEASARELYGYWRNLGNLPRLFDHLALVEVVEPVSRWIAVGPRQTEVEWTAEIVEDRPGELIAWRTLHGPVASGGAVRFVPAPGGRGTEVVVDMHYQIAGGLAGSLVAKLAGRSPADELALALTRLKQLFELGEVMMSDASMHRGRHPARPAAPDDETLAMVGV